MTAGAKAEREGREWTASVNGTGLRVVEAGVGAAVVFSPALFTNSGLFETPVVVLSDDYRCISYDHRGQGDSGFGAPQPSRKLMGVEGLYDDAVALLDELGVDSCHWVGGVDRRVRRDTSGRSPPRSCPLVGPDRRGDATAVPPGDAADRPDVRGCARQPSAGAGRRRGTAADGRAGHA